MLCISPLYTYLDCFPDLAITSSSEGFAYLRRKAIAPRGRLLVNSDARLQEGAGKLAGSDWFRPQPDFGDRSRFGDAALEVRA